MSSERRRPPRGWGWTALALGLAATPAAGAAGPTGHVAALELDPQRTVVRFTLPGALHETHGAFRLERGAMEVDPATGAASGLVVVEAASGDSGNGARDRRMSDLVLEAGAYPEIRFRPDRLDGARAAEGAFDGTIHGVLTLHGADHEVDLEAHGRLVGSDLVATCHVVIPYVAWGLANPSVLLLEVAKEVSIDVSANGHVRWVEASGR